MASKGRGIKLQDIIATRINSIFYFSNQCKERFRIFKPYKESFVNFIVRKVSIGPNGEPLNESTINVVLENEQQNRSSLKVKL